MRRLRPANIVAKLREERFKRRLGAAVMRDLTPPKPEAYGQYGHNTWVVPPARVTCPDRIFLGDRVTIHEHSWLSVVRSIDGVEPTFRVGDRTSIARLVHIACVGSVEIGPDVLIAERVLIGDTYHDYEDVTMPVIAQPMVAPEPVVIERGAYIGQGAVIIMGVTVGENAYVGAGAVVTRDVEPRTVVAGNPARPLRRWSESSGTWEQV